ncbi:unnamed protein product [marine sediment metagenome]|uniref:Uncharacterized protein n=1 Tax=marine sediment metagenome TaxID=412755 RepID=X0YIU9_9ZZZZ
MAWGGSLNKKGSDYLRRLREADKVIAFLESLKEELSSVEQESISKTVQIIIDYMSKIAE